MKYYILLSLLIFVDCGHVFVGTNVGRNVLYHYNATYKASAFQKRVENLHYVIAPYSNFTGRVIQGILAIDRTSSEASANITQGGIGYNYVNLRMKSERGRELNYDIYIYS